MESYQPLAIVLQCGADSLTGDRLGRSNVTIKGIFNSYVTIKGIFNSYVTIKGIFNSYVTIKGMFNLKRSGALFTNQLLLILTFKLI